MSVRLWLVDKLLRSDKSNVQDKSPGSKSAASKLSVAVKRIGLRFGDTESKDFEPPEFDLEEITRAYNSDSYIRQGVDKYVDQIFKEGYYIYGKNTQAVEFVKLRLDYISKCTNTPTQTLLIDIAEDIIKYANCIIVKARQKDVSQLPPGVSITGIDGGEPIVGYYCLNATTMKVRRDKTGNILGWQQEIDGSDKPLKFKAEDIIHMYYKKEKGNAFGTSFLVPVIEDVKALRQAEENVLNMMYRSIYPFIHASVGTPTDPGEEHEITKVQQDFDSMELDGGLITSSRVEIKAVSSNQVVNAKPYLDYLEERVFTGLGIPAIMFGRGSGASRSTGDNMTSEMSDRIKAIQSIIEAYINSFIIGELLTEGGYDPILNKDDKVEFIFKANDYDTKIKKETHAVFLYEHNSIDENEMRDEIGRDPISDRALMHENIVKSSSEKDKNKETDNKIKPTNQYGTKGSPKKMTNSSDYTMNVFCKDIIHDIMSTTDVISVIDDYLSINTSTTDTDTKDKIDYTLKDIKHKVADSNLSLSEVIMNIELLNEDISTNSVGEE